MMEYFVEFTDMGRLYLNYPMVELFCYHMSSIPDDEYNERVATLDELCNHTYKQRVNGENYNHDYSKFAVTRKGYSIVIGQNIEKGRRISNANPDDILPDTGAILDRQLYMLREHKLLYK